MAILSNVDRIQLWKEFMDESSSVRDPLDLTKADLRAAVDGLDDWLEANAAAVNQAIPQPARGSLTAKQKARLLVFVIKQRFRVA